LALVAILLHLRKKESAFAVIDTHAGRGLYDLSGEEARKTAEARGGIERLRQLAGEGVLGRYLEIAGEGDRYPGSPLIAAKLLRPQDRLVAIEKHPEEFGALKRALAPWRKTKAQEGDGYARLPGLLPPPERRGLVVIDPPFEASDEFEKLGELLRGALRRFASGIYLVWFPVKSASQAQRFCGEVLAMGVAKALRIDIAIAAAEGKLAAAGLLVLNPPFGFDGEMRQALAEIAPLLDARAGVTWLAGEGR
jgi:23S rRNA (adenine2030-N6)-methyltransferase